MQNQVKVANVEPGQSSYSCADLHSGCANVADIQTQSKPTDPKPSRRRHNYTNGYEISILFSILLPLLKAAEIRPSWRLKLFARNMCQNPFLLAMPELLHWKRITVDIDDIKYMSARSEGWRERGICYQYYLWCMPLHPGSAHRKDSQDT